MTKLQVQDLPIKGKRVLVRVDFNVPQNKDGSISDDTRIQASLPTIRYIIDHGGTPILMSHLGRPNGMKEPRYSLSPCAKALSNLLHSPVIFAPDCIGAETEKLVKGAKEGQIILLENVRFYAAEEDPKSDPSFAQKLAALGDLYVNDAFGTAHRAHSSTTQIAQFFPGRAAAGLLMQKEIAFLNTALTNPKRPFYAIIGGAKISTKIGVLQSLLSKVDALFVGGGMAYTLFKAQGISIGDSIFEAEQLKVAQDFLSAASKKNTPLFFANGPRVRKRLCSRLP